MLSLEHLRSLLTQHLNASVVICEFERKTYPMVPDTRPDASWRDHLLRTFQTRLRGAQEHNADVQLILELKRFVSVLESLDRTTDLYGWQAQTPSGLYHGWATANQIIYASKSKTEDR